MFEDIGIETRNRLSEAKWFLDNIIERIDSPENNYRDKLYKGTFFVNLYGALEYTVSSLVGRVIDKINENNQVSITDLKPSLLTLVLSAECDALFQAYDKKWKKRLSLFNRIKEEIKTDIENTLFPAQSGNIKFNQIEQICEVFGVEFEVVSDLSLKSRLTVLADKRNAIAHGRESSTEVGGNFTKDELQQYFNLIQDYCMYLNQHFYQYIENQHYIKIGKR